MTKMPRDYSTYRTHHASRRLRGYDYTRPAAYFVTICAKDHICLFGEIAEEQMHLNEIGRIVDEEWQRSEVIRDEITLDEYVIMPNHVHGIVVIAPEEANAAVDPHGYNVHIGAGINPDVATTGRSSLRTQCHENNLQPPRRWDAGGLLPHLPTKGMALDARAVDGAGIRGRRAGAAHR